MDNDASAGYYPFVGITWASGVFYVTNTGAFDDGRTENTYAMRPVINIRSDVTVSGDGTMDNPYRIQ